MSASLPPGTVALARFKPNAKRMTWDDIVRDRQARGLERDPRDRSNDAPCTVPLYTGPRPKSAAGAAKIRRESMKLCACRMCALALNPPMTFAEHARFVGDLHGEMFELIHNGPRKLTTHEADRAHVTRDLDQRREEEARDLSTGRDVFGNAVRKAEL